MKLWRIANQKFKSLNGSGGLYVGGRWHSVGKPVAYTAEHPALAALEVLVHMGMDLTDLVEYVLLEIYVPDEVFIDVIDCDPSDSSLTVKLGNEWLSLNESAVCKVPSVVLPMSYNFLLNPPHPDASKIEVIEEKPFEFDSRLFSR
jgi:RES domain-containing protein